MLLSNKYCRICWNTSGWRKPTGDAAKIETAKSYCKEHGFGHEEWLFNYEWIIDGYRYGFLQPMGKYYGSYIRQNCSVLLYTVTPEKETLLVAKIDNVYVPDRSELKRVLNISRERGWLDEMRRDVKRVGGSAEVLNGSEPEVIANVRFRPENVEVFDPRRRVVGEHKILRLRRYQPIDWIANDGLGIDLQPPPRRDDPRRSEREQTRAAQEASTVDPKHVRMQNRLYEYLCGLYDSSKVHYEKNFVDISIDGPDGGTYFEIKTDGTVKHCVREAIGQLLEYAHYPDCARSNELVVVGDAPPSESDRSYLAFLREQYDLPIHYQRFLWESNELSGRI